MSREKRIEEMAEVLRHSCDNECFKGKDGFTDCDVCEACLLYEAGYRKQSEDGLILTFDGASGYFPKEFITQAVKEYKARQDGSYLVNIRHCVHSMPQDVIDLVGIRYMQRGWISVDERLPVVCDQPCLVYTEYKGEKEIQIGEITTCLDNDGKPFNDWYIDGIRSPIGCPFPSIRR